MLFHEITNNSYQIPIQILKQQNIDKLQFKKKKISEIYLFSSNIRLYYVDSHIEWPNWKAV